MISWIQKTSEQIFDWFFAFWVHLFAVFGAIYLMLFSLSVVVIGVMKALQFLNMAHFNLPHSERAEDEAFFAALIVTIFILVLRIARDTEEFKKLSSIEQTGHR